MAQNKVPLHIAGLSILVSTGEDESYVLDIAREIDENVNAILDKSVGASVTNAILLCAIDYYDSAKKANRNANNMRNQIKEYMAEAASAKLELDEERKRIGGLESEIKALRGHLTRIATEGDTSGVMQQLHAQSAEADIELARLRQQNEDLAAQNQALNEKADAMSSYIAGQDREIARLSAVSDELGARMVDRADVMTEMADRLAAYENQIAHLTAEADQMRSQLLRFEALLTESASHSEQPAPVSDAMPALPPQPRSIFDYESPALSPEPENGEVAKSDLDGRLDKLAWTKIQPGDTRMAAFDIDISDLPEQPQPDIPAPVKSGDAFYDYQIDESDTILGFQSVPRDSAAETAELDRMHNSAEGSAAASDHHTETLVENASAPLEKSLFDLASSRGDTQFAGAEANPAEPEPKRVGRLESLVDGEDDMPNLNWTLNI